MGRVDYPPLLKLASESEYREHFHKIYCVGPLQTFDDIQVRFRKRDFEHAFFESSSAKSKDDTFSLVRSERMEWVKQALIDPGADIRFGYDSTLRSEARDRRVAIVQGNFVVIIRIVDDKRAEFVTCYLADTRTIQKIKKSRKWPREKDMSTTDKHESDDRA